MEEFTPDLERLQKQARASMDNGPLTADYGADSEKVVRALNAALATEIVCSLRYRAHHHAAEGLMAENVAAEFLEHAEQEQQHASQLAKRISQLGGEPNFSPADLASRAHSQYKPAASLQEMLRENLYAERLAVQTYTDMIRWIGDSDPTTRRVIEDILAVEEEHADELASMLKGMTN